MTTPNCGNWLWSYPIFNLLIPYASAIPVKTSSRKSLSVV